MAGQVLGLEDSIYMKFGIKLEGHPRDYTAGVLRISCPSMG